MTAPSLAFCRELKTLLLPAFKPCCGLDSECHQVMRWLPERGHVPRGFCGASGSLSEVRLVLVVAEPGDPHEEESYPGGASPGRLLRAAWRNAEKCFSCGHDQFHQNVREVMSYCWGEETPLEQQWRRTWITESVLCSATREGGPVRAETERACVARFLEPQLSLLSNAFVIALGRKAQRRTAWTGVKATPAWSVAPPGCCRPEARPSWKQAARRFREWLRAL